MHTDSARYTDYHVSPQWHLDKRSSVFFCAMLHRGNPPRSGRDMVARVQGREAAAAPGLVQM